MPPGMTVSRLRSYVAAVRAGSRRVMRDPAFTMVVVRRMPPRPSRTVPARIVMVGAWARARAGSRASSMDGLRGDVSGPGQLTPPRVGYRARPRGCCGSSFIGQALRAGRAARDHHGTLVDHGVPSRTAERVDPSRPIDDAGIDPGTDFDGNGVGKRIDRGTSAVVWGEVCNARVERFVSRRSDKHRLRRGVDQPQLNQNGPVRRCRGVMARRGQRRQASQHRQPRRFSHHSQLDALVSATCARANGRNAGVAAPASTTTASPLPGPAPEGPLADPHQLQLASMAVVMFGATRKPAWAFPAMSLKRTLIGPALGSPRRLPTQMPAGTTRPDARAHD